MGWSGELIVYSREGYFVFSNINTKLNKPRHDDTINGDKSMVFIHRNRLVGLRSSNGVTIDCATLVKTSQLKLERKHVIWFTTGRVRNKTHL